MDAHHSVIIKILGQIKKKLFETIILSFQKIDILLNVFLAIAVDNLADADSLTTVDKEDNGEGVEVDNVGEILNEPEDPLIERKKSQGSRRSIKSLKKRRNTQLHLDIEAAASENLMSRYAKNHF